MTGTHSNVARQLIDNSAKCIEHLEKTLGMPKEILCIIVNKAKNDPKTIVFPEGDNEKILCTTKELLEEGIAKPILIGDRKEVLQEIVYLNLERNVPIFDPSESELTDTYAVELYHLRKRFDQLICKQGKHAEHIGAPLPF